MINNSWYKMNIGSITNDVLALSPTIVYSNKLLECSVYV